MEYLNRKVLESLPTENFQKAEPYPFAHIDRSLTPAGYERLRATLPGLENFDRHEGMKRAYGQAPHNRYMLHYKAGLELPGPWQEFLDELRGEYYQRFLRRLLGPHNYIPTFSWHYAWEAARCLRTATRRASGRRTSSTSTTKTIGTRRGAARH